MKPKRPTETDLLAIVQNGFQEQLPRDREAQAATDPASPPRQAQRMENPVPPLEPTARITLTIPEDLRFRLRVALMNHQRRTRTRMTQDAFCAMAIAAFLEQFEGSSHPKVPKPRATARDRPGSRESREQGR